MAGPIQYSELFNNDVQAKLAELQGLVNVLDQDFQGLSKTITGMSGRINVSIKTNTQTLKELETSVGQVNVAAKGASDTLVKYGKGLDDTAKQTGNLKTQNENLRKIFDLSTASVDQIKERIKKLTADYNSMGNATDKNNTKLQALAKRIVELKGVQDGLSASLNKTKKAIQETEGSYNQMSTRLNQLRKDLKELPNSIDKQTGAWNKANPAVQKYLSEINRLDGSIKKIDATLGNHQRNVGNYKSALSGVGGQLASLAAGYLSVQAAIQVAGNIVKSNAEVSDSMSDVQRTAELTTGQVDDLVASLKKIDTRTSLKGLMDIAVIGGQLGIAKDQLVGFVTAIDKLSIVLSGEIAGGAEAVATALGKINGVFDVQRKEGTDVETSFNKTGSAILKLGQVGLATGDYLQDFTLRVAGISKVARIALPVMLAYGSVLEESGVSAEVAGTAMVRLISILSSKRNEFFAIAKIADSKLTIKEFTRLINTDAKLALDLFFKGLNKGGTSMTAFSDLLDTLKIKAGPSKNAIIALAKETEKLTTRVNQSTAAYNEGSLATDQFKIKNDNLAGSMAKLGNTFTNLTTSGGISRFFKVIIDGIDGIFTSIGRVTNSKSWSEFFVRLGAGYFGAGELLQKYIGGSGGLKSQATQAFPGGVGQTGALFSNPVIPEIIPEGAILGDKKKKTPKNELELMKDRIEKITTSLKLMALEAIKANKAFTPDPATIELLDKLQTQLGFAERGGRFEQIDTTNVQKGIKQDQKRVGITVGGISFVDDLEKLQSIDRAKAAAPLLEFGELLDKLAKADAKGQKDLTQVYSDEIQKRLEKTEQAKEAFSDAISVMRDSGAILGELFGQEFGNLFDTLTTDLEDFVINGKVGFEDLAYTAIAGVRAIDEAYRQGTDLRIEKLQLEKQAQVDIAGTNKDARLAIEKEYNDKIRAEKIKQAKIDKVAAVFEIGINTAIAVSKTLAETALFGIPLIPVIIGLGLAQVAAVLARPIPGFKHGTQNAPEGLAQVAEEGAEAIQSPSGHLRIAHKKQLTYLQKGSKVFTASETKRMMDIHDIERTADTHGRLAISLHDRKRDDQIQTMAAAFYASRTNEELIGQSVGKQIAKLPFGSVTFDENGVTRYIQTRTTKTKILNDRYSLK